MKNIETNFYDFINENIGSYIIVGESDMNRNSHYFVNDEEGVTACNKDISKRPSDLQKEKVFTDRKSAEKFKNKIKKFRDDIRWYIESK